MATFPDFPDVTIPAELVALGMVDSSYRNDMSPSLMLKDEIEAYEGEGPMLRVFVNTDEARGEGCGQYADVCYGCALGGTIADEVFYCDTLEETVAHVKAYLANRAESGE